jgi:hypothetical protein
MNCRDCVHYREPQHAVSALGSAVPGTREVGDALRKIRRQHDEGREQEFELWVEHFFDETQEADWTYRPAASPYCDLGDRYWMAEMRNAGEGCKESRRRRDSAVASCVTCVHRVRAHGPAAAERKRWIALELLGAGMPQHVDDVENELDIRVALELEAAYGRRGVLGWVPEHLDYCDHLSGDGRYVVCAMENPDERCPHWSGS